MSFCGGKVLRDDMGPCQIGVAGGGGVTGKVVANALVLEHSGSSQADIGLGDQGIAGIRLNSAMPVIKVGA